MLVEARGEEELTVVSWKSRKVGFAKPEGEEEGGNLGDCNSASDWSRSKQVRLMRCQWEGKVSLLPGSQAAQL